jgi:hypothetical protein
MTGLTPEELAILHKLQARLIAEAQADGAVAAEAGTSFTRFLERVGLSWLAERLPKIVSGVSDWLNVLDWLKTILGSL